MIYYYREIILLGMWDMESRVYSGMVVMLFDICFV